MKIKKTKISGHSCRCVVSRWWKLCVFLCLSCVVIGQINVEVQLTSPVGSNQLYFNQLPGSESFIQKSGDEQSLVSILTVPVDATVKSVALFVSDAEVQSLQAGGNTYYAGKYQHSGLLNHRWNYRYFNIPRDVWNKGRLEVKLKNLSTHDYTIDPAAHPGDLLDTYLNQNIRHNKSGLIFTIFFLGSISIFLLYMIGLSIQNKQKDFKRYAFYLGAILLHNGVQADSFLKIFFIADHPIFYHIVNEFLQMYLYIAFIYFLDGFLELKNEYPSLHRFVKKCNQLFILFSFVFLGVSVFSRNFIFVQDYLSIIWVIVSILSLVILWKVWKQVNENTKYYIIAGSLFLMIGSFVELFSSLGQEGAYNWNLYAMSGNGLFPFNYTQLAILMEAICFALGIGYKIRKRDDLLVKFQKQQIRDLESESQGKDSRIESLVTSIEEEKSVAKEAKEMAAILDMQYGVIRYQLNPHFLFNNLNAINNLIIHDQSQEASRYLIKFSKLLRSTIAYSEEKLYTVSKDAQYNQQYLEVEQLRLNGKFEFSINVDPELDNNVASIPPQIIQPYIEYALWNHLLTEEYAYREISIQYEHDGLYGIIIKISDNGFRNKNKEDLFFKIKSDIDRRLEIVFPENREKRIYFDSEMRKQCLEIRIPECLESTSMN